MFAAFMALALVAGACSSSGDDDEAAGDDTSGESSSAPGAAEGGNTTGVTDDTIKIAALVNDNAELADIGFAVEIGDTDEQFETFFDSIESNGRQVELSLHPFSSINTETQRAACLEATQDEEAFMVVALGGARPETILCTTEENETVYLASNAADTDTFDRSDGRLFSTTLDFRENMRQAVKVFDERGDLEGKTIGVFTTSDTEESQLIYEEGLKPALEEAGYEVAEEVTLPCPPGSCEQTGPGVQRMMDAGVDAVFTTINMVGFTSVVSAGAEAGFEPQYFATSVGNAEADVLAARMEAAGDAYGGALLVTTAPREWTLDPAVEPDFGKECNERYAEETGKPVAPWGDPDDSGWGAITVICSLGDQVQTALDETGEDLTQERFIETMEGLSGFQVNNVGNTGSYGPDKHWAADFTNVLVYDLDCFCWVAETGDAIPIEE